MRIIISIVCAFSFMLFFITGCSSDEQEQEKAITRITNEEILQKFNTKSEPGRWKNLNQSHIPIYSINKTKKETRITESSPFENTTDHYVEIMVLLDTGFKELKKQSFTRHEINPSAQFVLPPDTKGEFYLVLKCNLHDMWLEHIIIR